MSYSKEETQAILEELVKLNILPNNGKSNGYWTFAYSNITNSEVEEISRNVVANIRKTLIHFDGVDHALRALIFRLDNCPGEDLVLYFHQDLIAPFETEQYELGIGVLNAKSHACTPREKEALKDISITLTRLVHERKEKQLRNAMNGALSETKKARKI